MLVYPFGLPLSTWFSGHISALRDTEGHKKSASLLSVCDFVRNVENVQVACEASALPLSQAGVSPLESMGYADSWTRDLTANLTANVGILDDRARLR